MRWSCLMLVPAVIGSLATIAQGSGPADDLLRLVPADSGVTLVVEDLRGHSREIARSPLFEGLQRLPVMKSWLASDQFRMFERVSNEVQAGLGVSIEVVRDDLLGDAVILALQPGPAARPDLAQGLLLVRPRDRDLIPRLLKTLNEIQTRNGELDRVDSRKRGSLTYMVRRFNAGQRPPEFYIRLDDGAFAWSNSETMIQGVIDRKAATGSGLGDDARFRKVRQGLPDRALLSLFVNPRLLERLMADSTRSSQPNDDRPGKMLARYLGAVAQLGFAVEWREGFAIHSHEVLEPDKLEPWLKRWLTRPPAPAVSLAQVPSTAVALVSANLDFEALGTAAQELIPESGRASFASLRLAAQGLLLDHDPIDWVLPRLNPNALLYLDVEPDPETRPSISWVAVVGWQNRPGVDDLAAPIDNALRTMFALLALDNKSPETRLKVETRTLGETRLTSLTKGNRTIASYRTDHDQLAIGNSAESVARFSIGRPVSTLAEIRSKYLPEAATFAIVDAQRVVGEVRRLQAPIARHLAAKSHRTVAETERDLGQLADLAGLFRAGLFSTVTSKDATEIHRTLGLIGR